MGAAGRAGLQVVVVGTTQSADFHADPHVAASMRDYKQPTAINFLGKLHAATA